MAKPDSLSRKTQARRPRQTLGLALALLGLATALPATAAASEPTPRMTRTETRWSSGDDARFGGNCLVYTPPGFGEDAQRRWPLIVFFHGAGGKGADLAKLDREFVPQMFDHEGKVMPAIVICPQARDYWGDDEAVAAFDFAAAHLTERVDPDRIYVTGLSAGGGAAWQVGKQRADHLAALAPMCPYKGGTTDAANLRDVPIWTYHNVHDPYCDVTLTRDLVAAVRDAGNDRVIYTELTETVGKYNKSKDNWPHTHKDAWEKAYTNDEFWSWMFDQRRAAPSNSPQQPRQ